MLVNFIIAITGHKSTIYLIDTDFVERKDNFWRLQKWYILTL